jgi:tetratricopeptide (TPR) repeat protein
MTDVSLRAYTREIEGLVEHEQRLDEAIAHCRQILKTYPKHLETYRLLGKAYLEGRRYDEAVDVFERLLVAVPDDFVAHVGMSIIADDQGKLDDAIWHMERAFEVQPSNPAIQGELQRLFGRRDGVEPPKIRLTRGALAQMYVHGQLYAQAISEIRAVLSQDAERADLEVLLAKAYYQSGQKAEAAGICAQLLSRFPYCFIANALMVDALAGTGSAESSEEYRKRVIELDPYAAFAHDSILATDMVPDSAVILEHLEYTGEPVETGSFPMPGLQSSAFPRKSEADIAFAGADIPQSLRGAPMSDEEPSDAELEPFPEVAEGNLPDWVRALAPAEEERAPSEAEHLASELPSWLGTAAAPGPLQTTESKDAEVPEWLKDLGTDVGEPVGGEEPVEGESGGTGDEARAVGEMPIPDASPEADEGGLAWLQSLAADQPPDASARATPESEAESPGAKPREAAETTTSQPEGMREVAPEAGATEPEPSEPSQPDWLRSLAEGATYTDAESPEDISEEIEPEPLMGAPLKWPHLTPRPPMGDEPGWMETPASSESAADAHVSRETSGEGEGETSLPDWLAGLDREKTADEGTAAVEEPSSWLKMEGAPLSDRAPETAAGEWRQAPPISETEPIPGPEPISEVQPVAEPQGEARHREEPVHEVAPKSAPPAVAEAGPLPKVQKQTPTVLGTAQAEMGRGNIAAALETYGGLIHKGKSLTEIIRDLRDALYRYPVEVPIWQALGDAYMRANRLQEALDAYTKAEELLR